MPIEITSASKMPTPPPYSDQPILYWVEPTLGANIEVVDAFTNQTIKTRFRVVNVEVDLTNPAGTEIVYIGENGQQFSYHPFTNGWHVFVGWGIVSVAAGVEFIEVGI